MRRAQALDPAAATPKSLSEPHLERSRTQVGQRDRDPRYNVAFGANPAGTVADLRVALFSKLQLRPTIPIDVGSLQDRRQVGLRWRGSRLPNTS